MATANTPMPCNKVPASIRRWATRITEVEDDRGNNNGWWVHLATGWTLYGEGHIIHEDTLAECAQCLKDTEPCVCDDCVLELPIK